MTPAGRDALITRAKALAVPVASCVAARVRPDHLLRGASWGQLAALVVVLAEAADPVVLRAVASAGEDGPPVTDRTVTLRRAHAEANRLRESGGAVPLRLRLLENEYRASLQPEPAPRYRPPGTPAVVGAAIRAARVQAGMSRGDLAAALGVSEGAVRKWEYAERTPGEKSWVQLELTLGPLGVVREAGPGTEAATREGQAHAA